MQNIKTKTIELPTFEQLNDEEKETVINNYWDINVDDYWYESTESNAVDIGCHISSFYLNRQEIDFHFDESAESVAKEIIKNHGAECDTFAEAVAYQSYLKKLEEKFPEDDNGERDYSFYSDKKTIDDDFENDLGNCYLSILRKEYEYLTSNEAIAETLIANEYTFNRETLKIEA